MYPESWDYWVLFLMGHKCAMLILCRNLISFAFLLLNLPMRKSVGSESLERLVFWFFPMDLLCSSKMLAMHLSWLLLSLFYSMPFDSYIFENQPPLLFVVLFSFLMLLYNFLFSLDLVSTMLFLADECFSFSLMKYHIFYYLL